MKNRLRPGLWAGFFSMLSITAASADVTMPSLFSDNMVLQQESRVALWGKADPGEKVTIKGSWGASTEGLAGDDGKWQLFIETPKYDSKSHSLTVSGDNTLTFNNVVMGEVWLASGQSNMGWSVGKSFGAEEALKNADNPNLRIYKPASEHWPEPLDDSRDLLASWKVASAESVEWTSAVGYYFAEKIQKELAVPVGLIVSTYGGTPIEAWTPPEAQDPAKMTKILPRQLKATSQQIEQARAKWHKDYEHYKKQVTNGNVTMGQNSTRPRPVPRLTKPYVLGREMPGHVYNAMIQPVRPYGIKGMLWYQGERNAKSAAQVFNYGDQLEQMISYYRKTWHEQSEGGVAEDFPAFFTQLPSYMPHQTEPVEPMKSTWVISREQMLMVDERLENTGMPVSIDTGSDFDLHPKSKKDIGIRHAYQALAKTYGHDIIADGPRYEGYKLDGDSIIMKFSSVGSGLVAAKDEPINSFAIAGEDQQWHWAEAEIDGDMIIASSPKVMKPVAVRYAWAMNPSQRNLIYNREGLPASPFRTDDWSLIDNSIDMTRAVPKPKKPADFVSQDWYRPAMTQ